MESRINPQYKPVKEYKNSSNYPDIVLLCKQQYASALTAQGIPPEKQMTLLLDIYSLVSNSFDHYFNELDKVEDIEETHYESQTRD